MRVRDRAHDGVSRGSAAALRIVARSSGHRTPEWRDTDPLVARAEPTTITRAERAGCESSYHLPVTRAPVAMGHLFFFATVGLLERLTSAPWSLYGELA